MTSEGRLRRVGERRHGGGVPGRYRDYESYAIYIYISRHGRKTTRVDKASRMQTDGRAGIKRQLSDSCSPLIDEQNTFLGSSQGIQSADDDPTSPVPANSAALIYGTI
ncbi:hypothetical protein GW17_00005418 [Ensete ventricosum]|nr:hypothetical protein GW17_00005418 [Ensete ventricosum]RZR82505.1 hypothetical protein BHM03_00008947 [Ensete ventricosum]